MFMQLWACTDVQSARYFHKKMPNRMVTRVSEFPEGKTLHVTFCKIFKGLSVFFIVKVLMYSTEGALSLPGPRGSYRGSPTAVARTWYVTDTSTQAQTRTHSHPAAHNISLQILKKVTRQYSSTAIKEVCLFFFPLCIAISCPVIDSKNITQK